MAKGARFQAVFSGIQRGFVGHALIYVGAAGLTALIPFLTLPLIARWLGPSDFGIAGTFVAIVNVLILFVSLNTSGFISVGFYRDGVGTLPRLVTAVVAVILATSATLLLLGFSFAGAIESATGIGRPWLWTIVASAAGQSLLAIGFTVAQTTKRPLVYSALQIGYGAAMAGLTLVLVGVSGMGWAGRAVGQALAALLMAGLAIWWLAGSGMMSKKVERDSIRTTLLFGIPLLPHSFAAVAMGSMDRFALGLEFSPAVVGHYYLALQISSVFGVGAAAINQAWIPWLYERLARGEEGDLRDIRRAVWTGSGLLIVGAIAMAVLAEPLVALVGGNAYRMSIAPLRILGFYQILFAWYSLMCGFLFYRGATHAISIMTVCVATVQGLMIWALLGHGASGVALGMLVSGLAGAVAVAIVVTRWQSREAAVARTRSEPA